MYPRQPLTLPNTLLTYTFLTHTLLTRTLYIHLSYIHAPYSYLPYPYLLGDEKSVLHSCRRQMEGLSPKLTSLLYIGYSAAPDPSKKSIMKLYKLRWYADCLACKGMYEVGRKLLLPLAVQQVHSRIFCSLLWCV